MGLSGHFPGPRGRSLAVFLSVLLLAIYIGIFIFSWFGPLPLFLKVTQVMASGFALVLLMTAARVDGQRRNALAKSAWLVFMLFAIALMNTFSLIPLAF